MSLKSIHVTLGELIDAAITLGISARGAAKIARDHGYRFDNNEFARRYRELRERRNGTKA